MNGLNAGFIAKVNIFVRNYVNAMQDFMQKCGKILPVLINWGNPRSCAENRGETIHFVDNEMLHCVILSN